MGEELRIHFLTASGDCGAIHKNIKALRPSGKGTNGFGIGHIKLRIIEPCCIFGRRLGLDSRDPNTGAGILKRPRNRRTDPATAGTDNQNLRPGKIVMQGRGHPANPSLLPWRIPAPPCNRFHIPKNCSLRVLKSITYSNREEIRVNPRFDETVRGSVAPKAATIQDVAQAAKVSTATVSRALSNPDLLSERTRAQVMEAIKTTGYRVNLAARNLRMQRAGAVLILVPNLGKPFYSTILRGISDGFARTDYAVLISDTENRPLADGELVGNFLDGRIDGIVSLDGGISPAALDQCRHHNVDGRIVFACEWVDGYAFPSIQSDNAEGARLAIRHLYDLGHRKIAHVTGPRGNVLTEIRRRGMLEERSRLHLPARGDWIIRGDFSLKSGHDAAVSILAMDPEDRPTAVFCAADMVAFGLIAGLSAGGLEVPGDISVVGFDDIDMAESYVPALTTIRQDRMRLGQTAAARLLERLGSGPVPEPQEELLPVELIVRDSTARIAS